MDWFTICQYYYNQKYYDNVALKVFVEKEKITAVQYKEITGINYIRIRI